MPTTHPPYILKRMDNHTAELRDRLCPPLAAVYDLLVSGATNKQIAFAQQLEHGTVKNYASQLLKLTRKQTRLKLVVAHYQHEIRKLQHGN